MQRKRLEDMNLLDDFLFNAVMTFPGIGERFCKLLLQVIFGREIGKLRIVAQKAFGGRNEVFRGARLDVFAEEGSVDVFADSSVFDIEPDNNDDVLSLRDLPKRADDDVSEELMELLRFMEDTREVNAVNDVLREMQEMVDIVKEDGKVTVAYMKSFEIEQMWIKRGIDQGIKQGIDQGIKQGINQGIKQGIEQGRKAERANTLREKERADRLERELRKLRRGRKKV